MEIYSSSFNLFDMFDIMMVRVAAFLKALRPEERRMMSTTSGIYRMVMMVCTHSQGESGCKLAIVVRPNAFTSYSSSRGPFRKLIGKMIASEMTVTTAMTAIICC